MKTFLVLFILFLLQVGQVSNAGTVNLSWDLSKSSLSDFPDIAYKIFRREIAAMYDYTTVSCSTTLPPCQVTDLQAGFNYCFVARAFSMVKNTESVDSNEVCLQKPKLTAPKGFRVKKFQLSVDITNDVMTVYATYVNYLGEEISTVTTQKAML